MLIRPVRSVNRQPQCHIVVSNKRTNKIYLLFSYLISLYVKKNSRYTEVKFFDTVKEFFPFFPSVILFFGALDTGS